MIYVQLALFTSYILYIVYKVGILPSISDSWYKLGEVFTYFCVLLGVTQMLHNDFYLFLSGVSLWLVGVAAAFKNDKVTKILHYNGAVLAIGFALVYLIHHNIYWPCFAIVLSCFIPKNRIWWVELTAFYSIMIELK